MSTLMRPAGPQPARVYWVRRLVVLLLAVLVVVVLWVLLRPGGDATEDGSAAGTAAEDGEGTGGADAEGTEDAATDGAAATGAVACTAADLTLALTSDARSYPAGSEPVLTVAITNTGAASCTVDAGEAAREILITSGTDRIWSSLDCPAGSGERLLLLEPGARDEAQVVWTRVRSADGCPADLPAPRAGTYTAVATLLGASSAAAVFDLG